MSYDFMTLSPQDFEALTGDLLGRHLAMRLERFKAGKDSGIDLRHALSTEPIGNVVVQCKRYATANVTALMRSLTAERSNLAKLQPERYIVATSVGLSPENKSRIQAALTPWVRTTGDIFGADDLNALLREHPGVVQAHFKLWISSTAVLERVLNARIFAQTEATVESTRAYASRLVVHGGFDRALEVLAAKHHVMVVGNPGIGKSTLARMIMCRYMEEGFEPVWVSGSVSEAWSVVHTVAGSERKFIVVYDDFLGRFKFDTEKFGKNEDSSLLALIERAARLPNLRMVLTTREYILADAKRLHGTFNERAGEIIKFTLSLDQYSRVERAHMLFNHLYFSDLPDARLAKLVETKAYADVIRHQHFNPRIVESVSTLANSHALSDREYVDFFRREFADPSKLWEGPFEREISALARQVLVQLWTFGGQADLTQLRTAAASLTPHVPDPEFEIAYIEALKQLDGNFISTNKFPNETRSKAFHVAEFHNPSVEEFVERRAVSVSWLPLLVRGCISFKQVRKLKSNFEVNAAATDSLWLELRERARIFECA